jgi:Tol biopolymer transport system component
MKMAPDRWAQVERLYHAALTRPLQERAAFLAEACAGDEELRREVDSLLAQAASGDFLAEPAIEVAAQMTSTPGATVLTGQRIAAYELRALLGVGGMGEVYRARDTKLGRDVAIKILPRVFTSDPDRLARFEREARVLATLNHPHIGAIYGFEENAGVSALVLELVEGETLADRIARGAVPIPEALTIARQIADALDAAHDKGVVHRDLKPANIKLTPDGVVKVLDFGLAKLHAAGPGALSASPTITVGGTREGIILGTAAYMSPEQARGLAVDKRTDIWAFGCVLYELLTGRASFAGETISDTIAAILEHEPDWTVLPATTPTNVRRLLQRCLEKNPKRRLRDVGDAGVVALESGAAGEDAATISRAFEPARAAWIAAAVVAGAALTALALLAFGRFSPFPAQAARATFQLTLPSGVELTANAGGQVGISPDGRYIVFGASSDGKRALWLRPVEATDAKLLPGTEEGSLPFWSPDSTFVAFFAGGKLKKLEISTGAVQLLCDASAQPGGGAWSHDGVIVFAPILEGPLLRVQSSGGAATPVTTVDAVNHESAHMWPTFLPDGRHFVFQVLGLTNSGIYLGALDSSERTSLIHQDSLDVTAVRYAPSGHLVYVSNHMLVAQPFDARSLKLSGEASPLAQGFGIGGTGAPAFGVSDNGVLVFRQMGELATFQPTWFGRDGTRQGTVGPPGPYRSFDLSPDGQTLALDRYTEKDVSIWLVDATRGTSTRFTSDAFSAGPRWSPQGDRLEFGSVRDTAPNPFVRTLAGAEQRLARLPGNVDITSWAPNGRLLIGDITNVKTQTDLWLFSASGEQAPTPFIQTPFDERDAHISPDGGWVAFTSDEGGTPEIYVTTFPESGRRVRVSTQGGNAARWRDDGKELFFQTKGKLVAASVATAAAATGTIGLQAGLPRELFMLPADTRFWIPAKGGQRFLVSVLVTKPVPAPIQVVLNWSAPTGVKR